MTASPPTAQRRRHAARACAVLASALVAAPATAVAPSGSAHAADVPCEAVARDPASALVVELPAGWCVVPATEAAAGATAAWELLACGALTPYRLPREPRCGWLRQFTDASLRAAEERCRIATGEPYDDACFAGGPRRDQLEIERRALAGDEDPALAIGPGARRWHAAEGRAWLLRDEPANWGDPIELATYVGSTRVALSVVLRLVGGASEEAAARRARWRAIEPELSALRVLELGEAP